MIKKIKTKMQIGGGLAGLFKVGLALTAQLRERTWCCEECASAKRCPERHRQGQPSLTN